MTDFIPLFPLQMVVFPGEQLNLHIFEPRYRQLIRECEQNEITFGIPAHINNKVMDFGTEVRLLSIEKTYPKGEMDIKTEGIGIFKIHDFFSTALNKMYAGADIERLELDMERDEILRQDILDHLDLLFETMAIKKNIPANKKDFSTFELGHHVGFSLQQEYEFLTLPTERQRQQYMFDHMDKMIPMVKEMERLRHRAEMNGHFKNVIPPKF